MNSDKTSDNTTKPKFSGHKDGQSENLVFQRLELENWRNFVRAQADLQQRVLLVGPNASGKSNFLYAIRFLRDLVADGGGLQEAFRRLGGVTGIRALGARRRSDVSLSVQIGTEQRDAIWTYELAFTQDTRQRARIRKECVTQNGRTIIDRPDEDDREDEELLTETHIEQTKANRKFRELAEFFASVRYLHLVPQLVREPDRSAGRTNDPYGGDFLEHLARTPTKTQNAWLRRIREALRLAVPQLVDIELWRDQRGTPHLRGKYQHWRPRGAWQDENQFSDGTLRLIGLLWSILDGSGPLLLEEPELSLHPEIVQHLPQMLARAQRRTGRQIIISTHSPELLRDDGIGLDEVLLFIPETEGTQVKPASDIAEAKQLLEGGLTLADIVIPCTRPENVQQLSLALDFGK